MQLTCQLPRAEGAHRVSHPLLAPPWHTRALLALLWGAPVASLLLAGSGALPAVESAGGSYVPSLLVGAGLVFYVSRAGLPRSIFRQLVGRTWSSPRRAAGDLALALGIALTILVLDWALGRALSAPESVVAHQLLPVTASERALFVLFALAAGVSEELVYRGYLQQQLTGLLGNPALGLSHQALLFGIAHGEQGGAVVARFALYGALFGALALVRGSTVPGMVAHVALDLYAGFSS